MKHTFGIATALLVFCLFKSSIVSADPIVIDQQFIPIVGSSFEATIQPLASGPTYGQTFTVGISGQLVGADLALDGVVHGRTLNDVLVEVTTMLGGFPTSNVLASGTISAGSIPVGFANGIFTHVDFSSGPAVTAGQQLALLFFGEGDLTSDPNVLGQNSSGILYPGGQGVIFAFGTWHPAVEFFQPGQAGSDDFAFRTYVAPVPEPASFLLLCSGIVGVLTRRRNARLRV
jgi:hypothetical protein